MFETEWLLELYSQAATVWLLVGAIAVNGLGPITIGICRLGVVVAASQALMQISTVLEPAAGISWGVVEAADGHCFSPGRPRFPGRGLGQRSEGWLLARQW
jgi:hypothetical protein